MNKLLWGLLIAEFLGTLILVLIGDGVSAMAVVAGAYGGSYWGIAIGWGLAVAVAVYVVGGVSGAHINPAVTVALAMFGRFEWRRVIPYCIAQVIGAFAGAALVYWMYRPYIASFLGQHGATASAGTYGLLSSRVFFTSPFPPVTLWHAFGDEVILTAVLLCGLLAIIDELNIGAPRGGMAALLIGLLVAVIAASGGLLEGFPINPARDLGPRLFAYLAGWGSMAFPGVGGYWWVPIVSTLLGGIVGAAAYDFLVRPNLSTVLTHRSETDKLGGTDETVAYGK